MSVPIETLRGFGSRRVALRTSSGNFDGTIVSEHLTEHSVMLMFARHDDPQRPIVIDIDDIAEIAER